MSLKTGKIGGCARLANGQMVIVPTSAMNSPPHRRLLPNGIVSALLSLPEGGLRQAAKPPWVNRATVGQRRLTHTSDLSHERTRAPQQS
jgi:hypothetical protein